MNCYYTSDWMLVNLQKYGNSYSYYPWLIIQEGYESTIGSNVDADHQKVIRCLNEIGYDKITGRELIFIDEKYFRPAEIDLLLGDPTKANTMLGWKAKTTIEELLGEMVKQDCE